MENSINEIDQIWLQFKACAEQIRIKTSEAELLLYMIAEQERSPQNPTSITQESHTLANYLSTFNSLPSSEPYQNEDHQLLWSKWLPANFHLDMSINTVREVWHEWKSGSMEKPSVDYMNQRFGELAFVESHEERVAAITRKKIVEEIETHLENGREVEEVLVVASMALEGCNNDLKQLAQKIMKNEERSKATLFEPSSSSSS